MSKISESGYFFIHSGILEKNQIESCFSFTINYLNENYNNIFEKCQFQINVVENKYGDKYGHTYAWTDDPSFYNVLLGKNFDGTERIEYKEDNDWVEPEENYEEAFEKVEGSWGEEAEIEEKYKRPIIKVNMEPIVSLPAIKYTDIQKKVIDKDFGFLEIFKVKLSRKIEKLNSIFTNNLPENINEKDIFNYFNKFNKDINTYIEKNTKKKYQYPLIKIKNKQNNRQCIVYFSPLYPNTASFVINLTKKVNFEKDILFFSQCKNNKK